VLSPIAKLIVLVPEIKPAETRNGCIAPELGSVSPVTVVPFRTTVTGAFEASDPVRTAVDGSKPARLNVVEYVTGAEYVVLASEESEIHCDVVLFEDPLGRVFGRTIIAFGALAILVV
jgi:hypothetical protein